MSLGLALAIVLDTVGQLLWKQAAAGLPAVLSPETLLRSVLHDPLPIVVLGVFLMQLVNWLSVLRHADLSYAQPITSLSYVSVVLFSTWLLGERLDGGRLLGISLVLVGVGLIGAEAIRREQPR
ncbi:MAG: EamA family transporter [Caldimonas sp.]